MNARHDSARVEVTSGKVEIYSSTDRLEDVILRAVLGNGRSLTAPASGAGVWPARHGFMAPERA